MKLFEYAAFKEPTQDERDRGEVTQLIIPITPVMAMDEDQATMLAGRAIPEEELVNIDRITVAVRPF